MTQTLNLDEKGKNGHGENITINKRLFMQLIVFPDVSNINPLKTTLEHHGIEGVIYEDLNNPRGIGLLVFHEDPIFLFHPLRSLLAQESFKSLAIDHAYTMTGRTYSLGHESNLEDWLLEKPKRTVLNKDWQWAIWYPLRRKGSFYQLSIKEQQCILREHGSIGFAFGRQDYAHDIRLACHGLDRNDNDFVIGLVGKELHPLSALIQRMRSTQQTSAYMQQLGPFFSGRAIWQWAKNT